MEVRFLCGVRLWKSVERSALQPFPKRLMQTRLRRRIAGRCNACQWTRYRNVRIQLPVPNENVQTLDFLDQEHDRAPRGRNLCARVALETATPPTQDIELLGVKSRIGHSARLSPSLSACRPTSVLT